MNPTLRNFFFSYENGKSKEGQACFIAADRMDQLEERLAGVESWIEAYQGHLRDKAKQSRSDSPVRSQIDFGSTFGLIAEKISDLLDIDIVRGIFVKVWNEAKLFRKYLDSENYDPDETIQVTLADHAVTSSHAPSIEIRIDGSLIKKLHFDITAELQIEGAILEIQDGKIKRLKVGRCQGKGEFSCEGLVLAKKELKQIEFPGKIDFGDGITISPGP